MKQIFLDKSTNSIAVGCSQENEIVDYFDSVEDALQVYSDAFVDPSLSNLNVSFNGDTVSLSLTNQQFVLTKEQAICLRESLSSIC